MAEMICPHCGARVQTTDVYCPNCTRSLRLTPHEAVAELPKAKPARTVGWIVALGLLGICALAAFPLLIVPIVRKSNPLQPPAPVPVFGTMGAASTSKTACISNLKQVATGAMIYQGDYDDHNFLSAGYHPALDPYLKNTSLYYCPVTSKGYATNDELLKLDMTKVSDPSKTVYFYEGAKKKLSTPHSGSGGVAYADSHVKMEPPTAKLRWKPK